MAIKKYHRQFAGQFIMVFLLLQIAVGASLYAWQELLKEIYGELHPLLGISLPFLTLEIIAGLILLGFSIRPLRKIESAVAYATKTSPQDQDALTNLYTLLKAIRHLDASHQQRKAEATTEYTFSQSLLDHLPVGIIALDKKGRILYTNKVAPTRANDKEINLDFNERDNLTHWLEEVGGRNISANRWWTRVKEATTDESADPRFFDVVALYQQDGDANIEAILVCINRTDTYGEDENELDFMSLAAHELRGPITVIRGYLDVLRGELSKTLTTDQLAFFERLDVSADRLTTYINNVLNVSRYDRHHLQLSLREEKLSTVYGLVADDLALRAKTQNRLLNVTLPDNLPNIAGDRGSLSEVIVNLVDNAIKYSNEGGLVVLSATADTKFVEVQVTDNGIGIPVSIVPHVFDKFYRSHRSRENTVGTGLGLYIVKAIIESHGGEVSVKSEEGHGSTFSFKIPVYASVAAKLEANKNANQAIMSDKQVIKNHSLYRG
jgi:signal transduction histidine kinase